MVKLVDNMTYTELHDFEYKVATARKPTCPIILLTFLFRPLISCHSLGDPNGDLMKICKQRLVDICIACRL
jgi:hypothetical protein